MQPFLLLVVNTKQAPPLPRLVVIRVDGAAKRLPEVLLHLLSKAFDAQLVDHVHHPRLVPVLARASVSEEGQDGPGEGCCFGQWNPGIKRDRVNDAKGAHESAHDNIEAHHAVLLGRSVADVVDVRMGKVVPAARDADVELPRKVRELWVALAEVRNHILELLTYRPSVHHLLGIDPSDRTSHEVPHVVHPSLDAAQSNCSQAVQNPRKVLKEQATKLNILPRGDVCHANVSRIFRNHLGEEPHLVRRQYPVADLEAHHEAAWCTFRPSEHSDPLETMINVIAELLHSRIISDFCQLIHLVLHRQTVLLNLELLDWIAALCSFLRIDRNVP
mmetsp:Transcript_16442/g.28490  ORF Transcript_16442/g.28490 Transcript_16442/m.28490 type:complete len:331 (+) Transcript_16442:576-1568(+)